MSKISAMTMIITFFISSCLNFTALIAWLLPWLLASVHTHSVSTYINVLCISLIQNLVREKIEYEISHNNAKYTKYIMCVLIATLKETFIETGCHHDESLRLQISDYTVRKRFCFLGEIRFNSLNSILDTQTRPSFSSVSSIVGGIGDKDTASPNVL